MIAFVGRDELIVCEESAEALVTQEYFVDGGRDIDEYDRIDVGSFVSCSSRMHLDHAQKGPKLRRDKIKESVMLQSPNFVPQSLSDFRDRDFDRKHRRD